MKSKTNYFIVFLFIMIMCQQVFAENLELNDITNATPESIVTFELTLNDAPNVVQAMGFDITFNPGILSYRGYELNQTCQDRFDSFDANLIGNNVIRVGGFRNSAGTKIQPGDSLQIMSLSFTVLKSGNDSLHLHNLKDHFKDWSVKDGSISIKTSMGYEDVNNDGQVGLAEVIHLLQIVTGF